jgi:hypothetical protein
MMKPNGSRLELRLSDQRSLLSEGGRARIVWACVEQADLDRILREARRWSVTRVGSPCVVGLTAIQKCGQASRMEARRAIPQGLGQEWAAKAAPEALVKYETAEQAG